MMYKMNIRKGEGISFAFISLIFNYLLLFKPDGLLLLVLQVFVHVFQQAQQFAYTDSVIGHLLREYSKLNETP